MTEFKVYKTDLMGRLLNADGGQTHLYENARVAVLPHDFNPETDRAIVVKKDARPQIPAPLFSTHDEVVIGDVTHLHYLAEHAGHNAYVKHAQWLVCGKLGPHWVYCVYRHNEANDFLIKEKYLSAPIKPESRPAERVFDPVSEFRSIVVAYWPKAECIEFADEWHVKPTGSVFVQSIGTGSTPLSAWQHAAEGISKEAVRNVVADKTLDRLGRFTEAVEAGQYDFLAERQAYIRSIKAGLEFSLDVSMR